MPGKKLIIAKDKYDYEGYGKSLEKILDGVSKDYWATCVDVVRHQMTVVRNYLWVSAALIGAYAKAYDSLKEQINGNICFLVLGGAAFALCSLAFGICLYAMPARRGYSKIPISDWGEFSRETYNNVKEEKEQVYPTFLSLLINKIDTAHLYNFETNQIRAKQLRITSWLLIGSFALAIFVTSLASIEFLAKKLIQNEIHKMTNNNTKNSEPTKAALKVPEPPPTPKPTNKTIRTYAMDSYDPMIDVKKHLDSIKKT